TPSADRVCEVLVAEPEIRDAARPVRLEPVRGRVTFEHVTFAYDGVRQVLRGVSFDVAPGELIGLVGPSGGGKSTIANLIARFYDVTGGAIRIDGVDVRRLVTDDGRLVESGTHRELLAKPDGKYRRLYEMQLQIA